MEINRLSLVRRRAISLYKKYALSVPVDLNRIIEKKNIQVIYEENQVGIDGLCQLQKNPPTIILNTEVVYEPRKRFTLAHEIGHICIPWHTGIDLCSLDDPYVRIQGQQMVNTQELEANTFASELLMPTEWLKNTFDLNTDNLAELVTHVCGIAKTSIMACFYALENVLPVGELFLVKTDAGEFWKPFKSVDTGSVFVSIVKAIPFYNETSYWKNEFKLSQYNVIHYKLIPTPDFSTLNDVYLACNSSFEDLLCAITGGAPIRAIPYIDKIVDALGDKYYVIVKIGDAYFRHFRNNNTSIRMHAEQYDDINNLYQYIVDHFYEYGRIELSPDSCLLWVKEHWRGNEDEIYYGDPHELLKTIVAEVYNQEDSQYMLHSINGAIASINSQHPDATREQLHHFSKLRFETDPKYEDFIAHPCYEQYVSGKITSLIEKRKARQR